jgi:XRE family transcriptional regulator, regulator of sulfur utilization
MITRRDIKVAFIAILATLCIVAVAGQMPVQHSTVFEWNSMVAKPTSFGSVRSIFRGPTATLEELEMHVSTLNPGDNSHAAHKHPNEELVIIKEGTVETLSNGEWKKLGPGSIIFNASNEMHELKNISTTPATYHVINWKTDLTPKSEPQK